MTQIFSNPEQQAQFEKLGFVKVQFLQEAEIQALHELYQSQGLSEKEGFHSTMHLGDVEHRRKIDKALKEIITNPAKRLLNGYRPLFVNFIVKEPNGNSEVGVHQDWNYIEENGQVSINVWTPLVATNAQNGALYVLPGSHLLKAPPRYTPFEDTAYKEYNERIKELGVMIESKPGEAIIYDTRLIHFSFPNKTDKKRLAINFVNIPEDAQPIHYFRTEGKNQLECYHVDDNFFNTNVLNERPVGYEVAKVIPKDDTYFSLEELMALQSLAPLVNA